MTAVTSNLAVSMMKSGLFHLSFLRCRIGGSHAAKAEDRGIDNETRASHDLPSFLSAAILVRPWSDTSEAPAKTGRPSVGPVVQDPQKREEVMSDTGFRRLQGRSGMEAIL